MEALLLLLVFSFFLIVLIGGLNDLDKIKGAQIWAWYGMRNGLEPTWAIMPIPLPRPVESWHYDIITLKTDVRVHIKDMKAITQGSKEMEFFIRRQLYERLFNEFFEIPGAIRIWKGQEDRQFRETSFFAEAKFLRPKD